MKVKDEYAKMRKRLKCQSLESNWLKIIGFLGFQVAIASIYYAFHKNAQCLEDFSLQLIGINLTIYSINVPIYFIIYKQIKEEIDNIKKYEDFEYECDLITKIYKKELNLALYQVYISGILLIFSSVFVLVFSCGPLINNIMSIFSFGGVINLLISLLILIKELNKVHIPKRN